ncbi:uncharacterized protein LY89DRAFT_594840 [Mollisia scopiformis]|uniref:Initiation-specific alpha-1,6-mannosyltransferase n=1 Tax=Mollisia scopiformis TaxID=149040 RepID=A0A194WUF5_MOLSC|nr:uncharacterized protein LY89DRAFT_594840 [Mollisia scopiformis]KUJ11299.1 hypothetical protein LY89DRAFT_594840 [Mollisia scopiformis]
MSSTEPSQWAEKASIYLETLDLPRYTRPRLTRYLISILAFLSLIVFYTSHQPSLLISEPEFPSISIYAANNTNHLPHIPPKIWQIYLDYTPYAIMPYTSYIQSFITHSPSHTYTLLDAHGALSIISKLSTSKTHAHILPLFYAMSRRVLRADFLRYLLLAIEGGVYSDMDTEMLRPLHDWVPDEYKSRTKLIVGLEADQSPPVGGTTYEVQFCQWTLAGAAGHPALWGMVERILNEVQKRPFESPMKDVEFSDEEVLDITGPAGWTEVVYEYLSKAAGEEIGWRNLTGMRSPRLFGDILVLPIDAFASGVPHSGASGPGMGEAFVKHQFQGSWRGGDH